MNLRSLLLCFPLLAFAAAPLPPPDQWSLPADEAGLPGEGAGCGGLRGRELVQRRRMEQRQRGRLC